MEATADGTGVFVAAGVLVGGASRLAKRLFKALVELLDDGFGTPNIASTFCNCKAAVLSCATSEGEAFCSADSTDGDDSSGESTLDKV